MLVAYWALVARILIIHVLKLYCQASIVATDLRVAARCNAAAEVLPAQGDSQER
jgi:hypothetical protein